MKNLFLPVLLIALLTSTAVYGQTEVGGIELPATLKAGDQTISLNGGGIREKWWIDIYVGGLYLSQKSTDADRIIEADQPMGIRIHMVSGMVTSEKMANSTKEGFEKSTNGNTASIKAPMDKFIGIFERFEIEKGDIYDIVYVPEQGVEVYRNGKLEETINGGLKFKQALFGIWLCDDPADEDLKEGMLGG